MEKQTKADGKTSRFEVTLTSKEIEDMKWALIGYSNQLDDENKCEEAQKRMMAIWSRLFNILDKEDN